MSTSGRQSHLMAPASIPKALKDYQLGDVLGRGASGQVYRALKWTTGETVAIKEIQLSNIPKAELDEIMSEINLLKNLNHPNIVKYKGYDKSPEYLYIILEFCENGSLHNICKRFGKFPENLVAVYISQVLEGLVYLHEQGVIHRDIKGANILTNKDGCVKLADFGVAANTTTGIADGAVVGSPYWMAPEVIEQSGATPASDIWSVGCVVIELLEGKPPYHFLDPMPALFRIVQDDCPPIPEGASPIVKDFLYHCFQKDCNLRISAKKLLKHPWMVSARKQMEPQQPDDSTANMSRSSGKLIRTSKENGRSNDKQAGLTVPSERRPLSNYNFDEAVQKVQEWNEALRSPSRPSKHPGRNRAQSGIYPSQPVITPMQLDLSSSALLKPSGSSTSIATAGAPTVKPYATPTQPALKPSAGLVEKLQQPAFVLQAPEEQTDNWDDDFEEGISFKLHAVEKIANEDKSDTSSEDKTETYDNGQTIRATRSPVGQNMPLATPPAPDLPPIGEGDDYSDLIVDEEDHWQDKVAEFQVKNSFRKGLFHPNDLKTLGVGDRLTHSPGPVTAPLPGTVRSRRGSRGSHSSLSPMSTPPTSSIGLPPLARHGHSRSSSFANAAAIASGSGSFGRSDIKKVQNQGFDKYTESEDEDYDDIFGRPNTSSVDQPMQTLQLNTRLSSKSWLGDELSDEDDPFAEIDEGFVEEDLETNLNRDKFARLQSQVNQLIDELTPSAPDFQLRDACDQLLNIITENPDMQYEVVSSHGMLAILEVLQSKSSRDVILRLLQIVNLLVNTDIIILESFCMIGGIPIIMGFTSKRYPAECRAEASDFVRLLCHTSPLTLQMFIACRGLKVLVELLDEDFTEQTDLVVDSLNGIGSVFELQTSTTKNDFCRMFIREGLLDPLSSALLNVMIPSGVTSDEMKRKIIQILLVFCQVSQSDIHVRNALGTRKVIRRLLRACEILEPEYLVHMLKAVKHLSMNSNLLEVLQNANAIEILVKTLNEYCVGSQNTEMENHIFQTCFNLCRLNKGRQEEAAQAGIIPSLKRVIQTSSPLKQFALPILCDLASAGKTCRTLLWQHDGLQMYLTLLDDPYFQVSALEAILAWLQEEIARIEDELVKSRSTQALLNCFATAKANSFENLLDPLLKICRLSTPIAIALAKSPQFFQRIIDRLSHSRAVVRLNLLRLLRTVCDVHPNRAVLVQRYGMYDIVAKLSREDGAVLVRELAREIMPTLAPALRPLSNKTPLQGVMTPKGTTVAPKRARRTASDTSVPGLSSSTSSVASPRPIGTRHSKSALGSRPKLDNQWMDNGHSSNRIASGRES